MIQILFKLFAVNLVLFVWCLFLILFLWLCFPYLQHVSVFAVFSYFPLCRMCCQIDEDVLFIYLCFVYLHVFFLSCSALRSQGHPYCTASAFHRAGFWMISLQPNPFLCSACSRYLQRSRGAAQTTVLAAPEGPLSLLVLSTQQKPQG